MLELAGRVAVVTGGTSGIGRACAETLAVAGAQVVTWDILDGADVHVDVTDEASIEHALAATKDRFGVPSLAVAAAGVASAGWFVDVPVAEFDRVMGINLRGVFLTVRCIAREIVAAGLDGSLVSIASVNGMIADPMVVAYSTSKAAVIHMTRIGAIELGQHGIRVNAIAPGPTDTPMMARNLSTPGYAADIEDATPLQKVGTPEMIAEATVNVMRSDWITGQTIVADGGASLATARGRFRVDNVFTRADA